YQKSPLRRHVIRNAEKYIAKKFSIGIPEARRILDLIKKEYGSEISIGMEKEFGFSRYDYFKKVWDIPARSVIRKQQSPRKILLELKKKYRLILVSDAPRVWIGNVLKELNIQDIFR